MTRAIAVKILSLLPVLFLVSIGTFLLLELVPGDPALQVLGPNSTPDDYVRIRGEMGLDKPLVNRYVDWLGHAVRGDLGHNLLPPVESVSTRLSRAFPVNLELAALALVMALGVAVPLALWSAYKAGGRFDRGASLVTFALISIPSFLGGILLILIFAIYFKLFPVGQWARPGEDGWVLNLKHAFLPALTLAVGEGAIFARLLRSDLIATLQQDYILAAKAKGMPVHRILFGDALRPSSFSLITLAGVSLGRLIGGTVIVEAVFSLPGLGRVVVDAAKRSDYTVVQGGVLLIAVVYVLLNLVVDILYMYLDPRVRRGRV